MSRSRLLILIVAFLTIAAQLFVPITMAKRYEDILQTGESYLFKVEPIDPSDPFKGRFVVLTFPISRGNVSDLENPEVTRSLSRKSEAYVTLIKDDKGFTRVRDIQPQASEEQNYIKLESVHVYSEEYFITLPFNRYYAEESKAPKIESLLWDRGLDENREFYADVRIKDGYGVIAELYINNTPILEYLE